MIKRTLTAIALMLVGALSARAATETYQILNDSVTYNQVTVSSAILIGTSGGTLQLLTAVLSGATTSFPTVLENRNVLQIQNEDSTANLRCMVGLSSTSANGDLSLTVPTLLSTTYGTKVLPGQAWIVNLMSRDTTARVFVPWCVNDGGSGTSKVGITQYRRK